MSDTNGKLLQDLPLPGLNGPVVSATVMMLEQVLAEAKAGRVTSIAMVMVDPSGGVATPWCGPQLPQIYLGAGMMQSRIIRSLESPPKSSIIPARQV